jgi:hypothetical protein
MLENKKNPEHVNDSITLTRSIYLRLVALVYLCAFLSLFFQIQGLWGDEGILPAKVLLDRVKDRLQDRTNLSDQPESSFIYQYAESFLGQKAEVLLSFLNMIKPILGLLHCSVAFIKVPTLLWYSDYVQSILGYIMPEITVYTSPVENTMYILCLMGIVISTGIILNMSLFYNIFGFIFMWLIYLNFFTIGQIFMSFQWDIFLLEVGFLSILFAPRWKSTLAIITPIDNVSFFLIRFLMFRFIYANGIVKITADCPVWKTFTTLHHHFQGQPLPNLGSWYAHFLPDGILKILTALTFFIEVKFSNV